MACASDYGAVKLEVIEIHRWTGLRCRGEVRGMAYGGDICELAVGSHDTVMLSAGPLLDLFVGRCGEGDRVGIEIVHRSEICGAPVRIQSLEEITELLACADGVGDEGGAFVGAEAGEDGDFGPVARCPDI